MKESDHEIDRVAGEKRVFGWKESAGVADGHDVGETELAAT
mgnify:CR=1 FL=1|jgi:hypothetical protein